MYLHGSRGLVKKKHQYGRQKPLSGCVTISQNKIGEEEAVGPSHLMVFAGHVAGGCVLAR